MLKYFNKKKVLSLFILISLIYCIYNYINKKNINVVKIVVSPDYKPFAYMENQKIIGLDVEILQEIADNLNKKLIFKIIGFQFLFSYVNKNDNYIGCGGITITPERKKNNILSDSYFPLYCGIMCNKNIILNKDFSGKIGLQFGSVFKEIVMEKFPKATIVEIDDFMVLNLSFKQNNIDVLVADLIVLIELLDDNLKLYKILLNENEYGTGFLLNKNINVNEFNLLLKKALLKSKKIHILNMQIKKIPDFQ